MAIDRKNPKIMEYCRMISEICRTESDTRLLSKKLLEVLKNINTVKERTPKKFFVYLLEGTES